MSELSDPVFDEERGSEVDDYTGRIPRVATDATDAEPEGGQPSGFGDGDVADVDDTDAASNGEGGAAALAADTDALLSELDQLKNLVMRQQADFENFRKRSAQQNAIEVERATGRLAEAFLPVLDATESAYVQHPDEVGPLLNVLLSELKKHGLEALDLEAQPFDPEVADAVAHEPGSGGEVVVAEVLRSGYRWKGKTLRPAMVRTTD